MSISIRKKYFSLLKRESKYLNEEVIKELFCHVLSCDKNNLILHFDDELIKEEEIDKIVKEIVLGKPFQYVIGKTYFLAEEFLVDKNVLIPRQETEELCLDTVSLINSIFKDKPVSVLDIGTGSGNIAISLAKRLKNAKIIGIDISKEALKIAEKNNKKLTTHVEFINQDIFDDFEVKKYDVIISNPPYIKDATTVENSTYNYEPHCALFATPQTKFYERIFELAIRYNHIPYLYAFEIEENLIEELTTLIKKYLPNSIYLFKKDIYNKYRFLYIINCMNKDYINLAKNELNEHGVIAFPTDTVMGFGILFDDEKAYSKLNQIKRRPEDKPYTLMVEKKEDIEKYAFVNDKVKKIIDKYLPGPLTLLLPSKQVPSFVDHGSGVIGIRVAPTEEIRNIIAGVNKPLLVPSANRSGEPPLLNSVDVRISFPEINVVIDGEAKLGHATTIVDLTNNEIKIIREGMITLEDIKSSIGGE